MSGVSNSDVDLIWNSLKKQDVISFGASEISISFDKNPARKTNKSTSQHFAIKDIGRPFDIDAVCMEGSNEKSSHNDEKDQDKAKDISDFCSELFCGLDIEKTPVMPLDGDSDDDEEVAKENGRPQLRSNAAWRIERVAKALCSDDASSRVVGLIKMKDAINTLLTNRTVPPILNYDLPYNDSQIKLNQNLPLISDFVKPNLSKNAEIRPLKALEERRTVKHDDLNESKGRLQMILNACGNSLFRLIGDNKSEKCRILSLECLNALLLSGIDLGKHIPYMIPALCARYPPCTYDKDMDVFVQDRHLHEFYKRGGATDRQDRNGLLSQSGAFQVIEPNEELRLDLCRTFECIMRGVSAAGAERSLDAYYPEIIFSLQTSLIDPFPELKVNACRLLVQLLRIPHWEHGSKYFATGLARSVLPNCRHRNTNVIIAAMDLFEACVCVPDRAKVKGAGTAAIADLVGFREENAITIAAFYDSQCGISVNTLAELACHKNHRVRLRCCKMLSYFLVYLPDRYDHQQRLLPYILSFINDDMLDVQNTALQCIEKCGLQYECEHPDGVIERRQFGVDGEDTIDYDIDLPAPFARRPSLGARLFVRANTSRFFLSVLGELSNWKEQTRKRSAELLLMLVVYCEEYLTKDFQHTIISIAKAIDVEHASRCENDHLKVLDKIKQVLRLMAKYINPETYLPLLYPRISGDDSSVSKNSYSYATILSSLVEGASLPGLIPHWLTLASLLSNANCIGQFASTQTRIVSLNALIVLIGRVANEDYLSSFIAHCTGELGERGNFQKIITSVSRELLNRDHTSDTGIHDKVAEECINCLSKINISAQKQLGKC